MWSLVHLLPCCHAPSVGQRCTQAAVALTCKPHYILPRVSRRLHERVSRLFTAPLEKSLIGNINLQSLRRLLKPTAERRDAADRSCAPLSRAPTHARTHISHIALEGFQTRPVVWNTPTVPACGRARAVFLPLTCPRMPMKEELARGDVEEAGVLDLLPARECRARSSLPSLTDWKCSVFYLERVFFFYFMARAFTSLLVGRPSRRFAGNLFSSELRFIYLSRQRFFFFPCNFLDLNVSVQQNENKLSL